MNMEQWSTWHKVAHRRWNRIKELEAELAELKGRRCATCDSSREYTDTNDHDHCYCRKEHGTWLKVGFGCTNWEAKTETTNETN